MKIYKLENCLLFETWPDTLLMFYDFFIKYFLTHLLPGFRVYGDLNDNLFRELEK